ncbi:MAG TPA: hypothetical protein VKR31_00920 [Rhizomicrobium sp.]|nr:hypothetical protein [Rhizomicrobium sp.]
MKKYLLALLLLAPVAAHAAGWSFFGQKNTPSCCAVTVVGTSERIPEYTHQMTGTDQHMTCGWPTYLPHATSELTASFYNFYVGTQSPTGQTIRIVQANIIGGGTTSGTGTAYVPWTFGGSRSVSMAWNAADVHTDTIYPYQMGLTGGVFPAGLYWLRTVIDVGQVGGVLPTGYYMSASGEFSYTYDPNSVADPAIDTTAALNNTAGMHFFGYCYAPVLLGRFTAAQSVYAILGDSWTTGTGDVPPTAPTYAYSFPQRGMFDNSNNPFYASLDMGVGGQDGATFLLNTPQMIARRAYLRYENKGFEEYGIVCILNGCTLASLESTELQIWATMRSAGITCITRSRTGPRTHSTNNWDDETNQTYWNSNFGPGGEVSQYDTWLVSQLGQPTGVNSLMATTPFQGVDPFKWITNGTDFYGTPDGEHPSLTTALGIGPTFQAALC